MGDSRVIRLVIAIPCRRECAMTELKNDAAFTKLFAMGFTNKIWRLMKF